MRRFLEWLTKGFRPTPDARFKLRQIMDREGKQPYLTRYFLLGGPRDPVTNKGWKNRPFNVFLHKFHMGDDADALHNHPWKWSYSLILCGGYVEERRVSRAWADGVAHSIVRRTVRPGRVNRINANDYRRVDLIEKDCWTLFIA